MAYKTGDVAKMVGLTTQTLREYENHGLLEAEKSADSGYRYFQGSMVSKAIAIRNLRNLGFSIAEVGELFEPMEYKEYEERFSLMLERQKKALEYQKMLCEAAEHQVQLIQNKDEILHCCELVTDQTFLCLDYLKGETPLLKNKADFSIMDAWTRHSLFTKNYSPLIPKDATVPVMGLAVEQKLADYLGLPFDPPVYKRHLDRAVRMMAKHSVMELPGDEELRYLYAYAETHQLELRDDPFLISGFTCWEAGEEICCSMIYYPVKG